MNTDNTLIRIKKHEPIVERNELGELFFREEKVCVIEVCR
jgi:hypothetical protein